MGIEQKIEGCVLGAKNETRITDIERRMNACEINQKETRSDIAELRDDLTKRPQWSVLFIITALASLCTGLIIKVAL